MLGEAVLDYTVNGRTQRRIGNQHRAWAPHGCYPCRGRDSWVTIAVRNDAEWTALCRVLGEPVWTHEPRFANGFGR
jgi:crotonobetainyl-CoA:carnitine CoA-transferase CaiB-like acyl-CoA transferase